MTWGPGNLWVLDGIPSTRFPIYCRGNAAEVSPHVSSPLTRSIHTRDDDPQAAAFLELGLVTERDLEERGCALLTGNFGGYGYTNLSLARIGAVRTPLMSPTDFDAQMYGSNLGPPYVRRKGDRDLRATLRILRQARRMLSPDLSFVETDRAEVEAWVASAPDPASQTNGRLFTFVQSAHERFAARLWSSLFAATAAGLAGSTGVERLVALAKAPAGTASRLISGVGSIESAEPSLLLWHLGRLVASHAELGAVFDAGTNGLLDRLGRCSDESGSDAGTFRKLLDGFEDFLRRHGHRGPDEWEFESDTWGTRPEIALEAIDRLRRAPATNDPAAAQQRLSSESETALAELVATRRGRVLTRPLRRVIGNATVGSAARERTKSTAVLAGYPIRLALFELARRAVALGGPALDRRDVFLLTLGELERYFDDPAALTETVADRRARRDYLEEREPPFWFEGTIPDPSTWALRGGTASPVVAGEVLTGVVVSTGHATGRARVIHDPASPRGLGPGDVLVAPFTDPAWTILFLAASAVVVDVGAVQSHAAIVARELGIPAVVSVEHASRRIPDGAELEVDADAGTVTIVSLPS